MLIVVSCTITITIKVMGERDMKIKFFGIISLIVVLFASFLIVGAQMKPGTCGTSFNVTYIKVDDQGYAPRFGGEGSESQFNCVASNDTDFWSKRFPSAWEALNYWFTLYGQELGVTLQPLPAPTS